MNLSSVDPTGDGTAEVAPYPAGITVYNGDKPCKSCGYILNPVQALNSDICSSCSRRRAAKQIANKMA